MTNYQVVDIIIDIIIDIKGQITMKTKDVLPATGRKALWVDRENYALVRNFAAENHITIASATNILLGSVFVKMEGGDFGRSRTLQDLVREEGKDKF